jgi:hypothetical protein
MHAESFDINYLAARRFMISINVLTAIAGLSNVIAGNLTIPNTIFQVNWIFGGISIGISTLNMLQDKLGYQQIADQHKKYASQWAQITSKIEEMLSLPPNARRDCKTFLKMIKADMNQVSLDGNSLISDRIRDECYNKFKDIPNFDIPEICGKMSHTNTYNDILIPMNENNDQLSNGPANGPANGGSKSKTNIKAIPSKKLIDTNNISKQQTANFNQVDTPPDSPRNNSLKPDNSIIGSFTNDVKIAIDSIAKDISIAIDGNTNSSSIVSTVPSLVTDATEFLNIIPTLASAVLDNKINSSSIINTLLVEPDVVSNILPALTSAVLDNNIISSPIEPNIVLDNKIISSPIVNTLPIESSAVSDNETNSSSDTDDEKNNSSTLIPILDSTTNQQNQLIPSTNQLIPSTNQPIPSTNQPIPSTNQQKPTITTIKQNSRKPKNTKSS